ncbi:hypothetical protein [Anaerococcus sp. Marseille-P3625]|uniref:hypothetical protein n=1 Tax=Anaerococcus sp. Marseille-P3625 TaxID=1977277 RepID=UPI000C08B584|nr:hypothetical protein [Anaerococcus sp. Marseille-P3625]
MLIKNDNLVNSRLIIDEENSVKFDEYGMVEIEDELAKKLLGLKGYELVDDNKKEKSEANKDTNKIQEVTLGQGKVEVESLNAEKEEVNYETLSIKELKELIKAKGEKAPAGSSKAELIETLLKLDK